MDLSDCTLCPRSCRVNRLAGRIGYCNVTADLFAARAALYYHEEPVISGSRGSGAVFFAGCNMGCVFCQNYAIAKAMTGTQLSSGRLTEIFLSLQEQGAHNINLITAEHFLPQVIRSLRDAKDQGLTLPVVYNTGTYERVEAIQALEGLVDVWLPDFKYISPRLSLAYSHTPDYFQYASKALQEMVRQCPEPLFSDGSHTLDAPDDADDPLMVRGVLVRHLVLPGHTGDSMQVIRYLHETYGNDIYISIMNQYTPPAGTIPGFPELSRKLTEEEYDQVVDFAVRIGVENGFIQEGETAEESFIPAFDGEGV
jgi:putative pyruvate formate lyase activating enzyme